MAQRIRIRRTRDHPRLGKGHAVIQVEGTGLSETGCRLYIKRLGYAANELGADGWQASEEPLTPMETVRTDAGLDITVGPDVVGHMDKANYQLVLECDGMEDRATGTMTWRNVTPCTPTGRAGRGGGIEDRQPAPEPPREPEPEPAPEPAPPPPEPEPYPGTTGGDHRLVPILVSLVLLVAVVGGIWFMLDSILPGGVGPELALEEVSDSGPAVPPDDGMGAEADDAPSAESAFSLADYRGVSAQKQYEKGVAILDGGVTGVSEAQAAGVAQRLFDMAAAQGHAEAARRIGRLYDPGVEIEHGEGRTEASMLTAYTWYRKAMSMGSAGAEQDLADLYDRVRQAAAEGDARAQLLLERRWPE